MRIGETVLVGRRGRNLVVCSAAYMAGEGCAVSVDGSVWVAGCEKGREDTVNGVRDDDVAVAESLTWGGGDRDALGVAAVRLSTSRIALPVGKTVCVIDPNYPPSHPDVVLTAHGPKPYARITKDTRFDEAQNDRGGEQTSTHNSKKKVL